MIGLTIGLFLTLGMFTLIANSSNVFKVQDDFARMQENASSAMRYISTSLRSAGFYGYAADFSLVNTTGGAVSTVNDCGSATNPPASNWALGLEFPVFGLAGLLQQKDGAGNVYAMSKDFRIMWLLFSSSGAGSRFLGKSRGSL